MEHTPPPFFKRGPAPLVRLFFFASLSLALLVIDARFRYAEGLRTWLALAAYPLQRAATAPVDLLSSV
ncbi:MAG: rod shape-determining protein MreC, partial [Burkholderiales bacterium]